MKGQAAERREHSRQPAVLQIVLKVELHGFDVSDSRFLAGGRTVNMSCGGLLARVDREIPAGTRCLAHFPGAEGRLGRTMIYGTVRRSKQSAGEHEVAMLFDTPLVELRDAAAEAGSQQ